MHKIYIYSMNIFSHRKTFDFNNTLLLSTSLLKDHYELIPFHHFICYYHFLPLCFLRCIFLARVVQTRPSHWCLWMRSSPWTATRFLMRTPLHAPLTPASQLAAARISPTYYLQALLQCQGPHAPSPLQATFWQNWTINLWSGRTQSAHRCSFGSEQMLWPWIVLAQQCPKSTLSLCLQSSRGLAWLQILLR